MKKILLLALCFAVVPVLFANQAKHERADADVSQEVRQTPLTIQSGPAQRTVFHGKPPVNPDASRALLWDQAATQYVNFAASQWDSVMAGGPFDPEFCDNFDLAADATIDSVIWWGGYWNGTPAPPLDFWIKIYPDSGGGNGPMQTPIYSERVSYTETLISAVDQYYYYEATIPPFAATAGVTYYIVFQSTLIYPPQYGLNVSDVLWGDGNEGYFKSAYFAFPDWLPATIPFGVAFESSFQLYGTAGGPSVLTFDFEDGWQGWTNTNGDTFPFAWGVLPSGYYATWAPPDAGDSCMWIDSDAAGSGSFLLEDTVLSPVLVPNPTMDWLKYGLGYNFLSGTEYLEAGIKYFDGATWTVVPLRTYTADFGPAWDSVDVSAYAGYPNIQVYFFYTDQAGWYWYSVFDNLSIDANLYSPAAIWDFETGWQGWTQTNGQVFPAAWGVQPSGIHPPCPDPGDSSMWIDSDASGGGYSDSALSPVIVPASGVSMLKYGYYNYGGSGSYINDLYVGINHFTSGAWTSVQLAYYPNGVVSGPAWDSVDVSAYAGADSIQAWFYHTDLGTWGYYSAFDNVEFLVPPSHDVGCTAVISPPEGSTAPADYDVIGEIWNFGGTDETFDVVANVYDTVGMVNIFTQT
ncbi:hypothetical protein KAS45_05360, partial [candidate division WOR-3 bacterium]|nr:hypothetical protein [candidate division WOR-3 bacterium]